MLQKIINAIYDITVNTEKTDCDTNVWVPKRVIPSNKCVRLVTIYFRADLSSPGSFSSIPTTEAKKTVKV